MNHYSFMKISAINLVLRLSKKKVFPKQFSKNIFDLKTKTILDTLKRNQLDCLSENYYNLELSNIICNKIWVCWFQGENDAPLLVRKCIENLKLLNPEFEVHILTLENYSDYVSLPDYILTKFKNSIITHTQLSDILRFALLANHGGFWIDATYLTLKTLPTSIKQNAFFSLTSDVYPDYSISQGHWAGNFLKFGKNDPIAELIKNLFFDYWAKNNQLIDYFLIDYYLKLIYDNNLNFKVALDSLEKIGDNRHFLNQVLFKPINNSDTQILITDPHQIYKLTYKYKKNKEEIKNTYFKKYIN